MDRLLFQSLFRKNKSPFIFGTLFGRFYNQSLDRPRSAVTFYRRHAVCRNNVCLITFVGPFLRSPGNSNIRTFCGLSYPKDSLPPARQTIRCTFSPLVPLYLDAHLNVAESSELIEQMT